MKKKAKNKIANKVIISFIFIVILLTISYIIYYLLQNQFLSAAEKIIKDSLVEEGNGLYRDTLATGLNENAPFSSKYYFKGDKLNNYIIFEGSCWHIINIAQNNTIKIMYIGSSNNNQCINTVNKLTNNMISWNEVGNNTWDKSTIQIKLKEWELNNRINEQLNINFNKPDSKIVNASWYVGAVRFINQSLSTDIEQERTNNIENNNKLPIYEGKLGLITVSDYLKASCEKGAYASTPDCKNNNFLVRDQKYWTMTATDSGTQTAWALKDDGSLTAVNTAESEYVFYPVIYLKDNIKIKGSGAINDPYIVID